MARQPQVLLVAHHANPAWGSEPLVAWNWARNLAQHNRLTLITHIRNKADIEADGRLNAQVRYVRTERLASLVQMTNRLLWSTPTDLNRMVLGTLGQLAFDRGAVRIARQLIRCKKVDLIHRVSPISPHYPTKLGSLGVPLILGPLNGGHSAPAAFRDVGRRSGERVGALRALAGLLDLGRKRYKQANCILVATEEARATLPMRDRSRALKMSENGVDLSQYHANYQRSRGPLRVLFVGRLIPCKGLEYLLRAVALLKNESHIRLDIVGGGPERAHVQALIEQQGLSQTVQLHGQVPVENIPAWMASSDLLCLPSVRESGGAVVLEAMASGKPVVVANHGGPAELVDASCGFRIPVHTEGTLVCGFARAIALFASDEDLRQTMGRAARTRVELHYAWRAKVAAMQDTYLDLLTLGHPRTPNRPMPAPPPILSIAPQW